MATRAVPRTLRTAMASLRAGLPLLHGHHGNGRPARGPMPDSPVIGAAPAPVDALPQERKTGLGQRVCQGIGDGDMHRQ